MKLYLTPNSFQKKNSLTAFCIINKTNKNIVKENKAKRIVLLYFSVNNKAAKNNVFKPTKAKPISGKTPPYSLKILFPERI